MDSQAVAAGTEDSSRAGAVGGATTLLFRHVPRKYTRRDLLAALQQHVTCAALDLVYIPWDKNADNNKGFAFVNFVDAQTARLITAAMDGSIWPRDSRMRQIRIEPALVQGLAASLRKHHDNVKDRDPARGPLLFHNGQEIPVKMAFRLILRPQDNLRASAAGSTRAVTQGPTSLARARPPLPEGPEGARSTDNSTARSDRSSNVSISHGSPFGLSPGSALTLRDQDQDGHRAAQLLEPGSVLMFRDQDHDGHRAAQLLEQAQARFVGVGAHAQASGDGFFEDWCPASTSTSSWGAVEVMEPASSQRDIVRRSPAYASAWCEVNFLLGQLKQTGAF